MLGNTSQLQREIKFIGKKQKFTKDHIGKVTQTQKEKCSILSCM